MKPKKLSPKVISDLHRHVWWLINLRDGINYEAQQLQLCTDIANQLAPYGIDATIHRHWTVPMNDNRVDVFLSYWEPGKMSASVVSEIIEFHNVSDTLLSRMRLYVEFRRFFRRLQAKLFSVTLSELTGPAVRADHRVCPNNGQNHHCNTAGRHGGLPLQTGSNDEA